MILLQVAITWTLVLENFTLKILKETYKEMKKQKYFDFNVNSKIDVDLLDWLLYVLFHKKSIKSDSVYFQW
jgi:hypothetical protein